MARAVGLRAKRGNKPRQGAAESLYEILGDEAKSGSFSTEHPLTGSRMRENRPPGLEGGGAEFPLSLPLPLCALCSLRLTNAVRIHKMAGFITLWHAMTRG